MNIVFIGDFSGKGDEGLTQISKKFIKYFKNKHNIKSFKTNELIRLNVIKKIKKFKPDIIHYLTGPTIRSFVLLWVLCKVTGCEKTIISATRPFLTSFQSKLLLFLKPSLILTQASKWENIFKKYGIKTQFMPNPVDIDKFKVLNQSKLELRKKYNLPVDKNILLHVGHIKENRYLDFFKELQNKIDSTQFQVVIIGSTFHNSDLDLKLQLEQSGCIVINKYIPKIQEIYNASDFYIFHINNLYENYYPKSYQEIGVIDLPFSILEAIACGVPVFSTPIDALKVLISKVKIKELPYKTFDGTVSSLIKIVEESETIERSVLSEVIHQINQEQVFLTITNIYKSIIKN